MMDLTPDDLQEFSILLQSHIKNFHRIGTQVTGSVPWREDKHPSFSADTEKGVWYDHAREEGGGIKEFKKRLGISTSSPSRGQPQLIAVYSYQDEAGRELFQILRYAPRTFKGRRPNGHGGWIYNLDNVRRVLYRLPQLVTADTVYIVEGEKDADTLRSLGLPATTNPHGAGKWREEYGESLRGKHVIILPDNDKPGTLHAQVICRSLSGKVASIKVVTLPGLPEKGDVSDWLNAGHTKEELLAIISTTPLLSSQEKSESYSNGHDLSFPLKNISVETSAVESTDMPDFPCLDIVWRGHHAAIADILGVRDWRVWLGVTAALSARANRSLHCNYYADLFGMGYWLLVSGSSTGKSLVTRLCSTLLPPIYRKKYSVESGQGLINLISESEKDESGKTVKLIPDPTILLLSEWSTLLANMDLRGSSLMEKLNECYDAEHAIEANRVEKLGHSDSASVENPTLTIIGTTTVQSFRKRIKDHHRESGFLNRHFLLPGPHLEWKYNSEHENFPREELIYYAHQEFPRSHAFGLARPMRDLYEPEAYYFDDLWGKDVLEPLHNTNGDEAEDGSPYRRLHAYARRIAALFAWSEMSDLIQLHHVEATHAVVETSLNFLRWLLTDGPVEMPPWQRAQGEVEEKIIRKIKEHPGIQKDVVCKALRKNGGYPAVAERIDKLIKSGGISLRVQGQKKCLYLAS